MAKRQKASLQLEDFTTSVDASQLNQNTCLQKDATGKTVLAAQDQDVGRRKLKIEGGLFERVLMGQINLQDAQQRGLRMTSDQQELYRQVRAPATLFW